MATLVLDFDSCLVPVESLDLYAERVGEAEPLKLAELQQLTRAGMDGEIPFAESLRRRLEIIVPQREGLCSLGQELSARTTPGSAAMVDRLQGEGHEVWIVSGGFREVILPVAEGLGIPEGRVHGLYARFDPRGRLVDLDEERPFHRSKVEGLSRLGVDWARPAVGVGDGMTDLALWEKGFLDAFIAYTEHVARPALLEKCSHRATSMAEVEPLVRQLWMEE